MIRATLLMAVVVLAGCAPMSRDVQSDKIERFESVSGKAVIFIVRRGLDSEDTGTLVLDEAASVTTYPGTYYRWEVAPGTHRITGFAPANLALTLQVNAGSLYFVEHSVLGNAYRDATVSYLEHISESEGRHLVSRAKPL